MKYIFSVISLMLLCIACGTEKKELYKCVDSYVDALHTTYVHYGLSEKSSFANNGYYMITPIGRLISVRIEEAVSDEVYDNLKKDLENRYKNDIRVNRVYRSKAGTIMIDCRKK